MAVHLDHWPSMDPAYFSCLATPSGWISDIDGKGEFGFTGTTETTWVKTRTGKSVC